MVLDLFSNVAVPTSIRMEEAEVYYLPTLALPDSPDKIMYYLVNETPWRAEEIVVWGKKFLQPRLVAWYGDPGRDYNYSGIHLDALPWTPLLLEIRKRVEDVARADFNSVLLNYYRDNRDSMGLHSDDEPELGDRPIIASVSLGEERTFILKHKREKSLKPVRLKLESGSLLLMKGETQHNWKHGIDKETRHCGPRINLTFRRIITPIKVARLS